MAEVRLLLDTTRLLTLVGTGGTGKTRLSQQVGSSLLDEPSEFPDGVWLVELAPLSDQTLVPQAVAKTLGIEEEVGKTVQQTLTEHLKDKHLLILLDNCDHLILGCAQFAASLLRACSKVKVLTTSREPLGIGGELIFLVPSLSIPDAEQARVATPETLDQYDSVRLFTERAQFHKPDFAVTRDNASSLAHLCYRLEGIPLAIELAAARVRSLSVHEINNGIDSRFRLLTGGDPSALPRLQTMRASIDWSYDLLHGHEKVLFARLSVFVGGWTLEAVKGVCGFNPLVGSDVLDLLTTLIDKSLVLVEVSEVAGTTRYRMLETLRQYAVEKRNESGEKGELLEHHRNWFLGLAEEAASQFRGPYQELWLNRIETEHGNFRAALTSCSDETSYSNSIEATLVATEARLRLTAALSHFWFVRGHHSEGRQQHKSALNCEEGQKRSCNYATVLLGAAGFAFNQGDYDEARTHFNGALAINEGLENKKGISACLCNLGTIDQVKGDYKEARELYRKALVINKEIGKVYGIATCLCNIGNIEQIQCNYSDAKELYTEALEIYRELGDRNGIALCFSNLGLVALSQGEFDDAKLFQGQSLSICNELGNKSGMAICLCNIGNIHRIIGDYENAIKLQEESLEIRRELEDKSGIAMCLGNLGNIAQCQNDYFGAAHFYAEVLAIQRDLGEKNGIATCLGNLGNIAFYQGDYDEAMILYSESLDIYTELGNKIGIATCQDNLGEIALIKGDTGEVRSREDNSHRNPDAFGG